MKFKLNRKTINIKTSWHDLTYGEFLRTLEPMDYADTISIISGIDAEYLRKSTIKGLEQLMIASQFLGKPPVFDTNVQSIGPYKLPLNKDGVFRIEFESLGQFEDMRTRMSSLKTTEDILRAYGYLVAIYVQKIRDGEYDYSNAVAMSDEIKTFPAHEVVSAGNFFIVRLLSLLNGTTPSSPRTARRQAKNTGKRSKKRSARTRR